MTWLERHINTPSVTGGIDVDPSQPGYKHILRQPQPVGGLTHAKAELQSMYGLIRSAWRQENDRFDWRITVPPNTTASVYIPANDKSQVTENGGPAENGICITFLHMENGSAVFDVTSGSYSFSSQLA